ncbi:MAG: hypothetical protein AAFN92_23530 [Bacteroidota bacterium]
MRKLIFSLLLIFGGFLGAQIPLSPEFSTLLDSLDVRVNHPLGGDFKLLPNRENDYLEDQLTVYGKEEKLEVRFHLEPENDRSLYYQMPHVLAGLLAANLGSNEADAVTAVHSFGEEEMIVFNADWAQMYTFRPKRSYSTKAQAQLIALYKEGRGGWRTPYCCSTKLRGRWKGASCYYDFANAPVSLSTSRLVIRRFASPSLAT